VDADLAALARCVGDLDEFASGFWGRRPMLRRGAGSFDDLLSLDAVDRLLLATARTPTFRLVRDGTPLSPDSYTATVRMGGTTIDDAADVGRIAALVGDGATLVLQGLQRTWLPLIELCRSLERATSHAVQANAYLTPAGAAGLGRHRDTHDVLVLQVLGAKRWDVDDLGDLTLAAGDVLYLPTGTGHAAAAQETLSLHLTIGLLRDTYAAAMRRVVDDLDLDRPLPLGYGRPERSDAFAAEVAEVLADVAKRVADADPVAVAARESQRARRRRRPLWSGQLQSVLAIDAVGDTTRVRRRVDNPARLLDEPASDGRILLELADRRLRLPPHTAAALQLLLSTDDVEVSALPGLDRDGRTVLARRLVKEGLLEIVG
jgi:bifunctional lysine-specific demethylase and histidyl-hydroxylase NO66